MPEKDQKPSRSAQDAGPPISDQLLAILVCPQCRQNLEYDRAEGTFTCHHCRLRFSIVDGVPNFLIEEAERI
jgi:uncharacterized protein YbaR (Trm112 family)